MLPGLVIASLLIDWSLSHTWDGRHVMQAAPESALCGWIGVIPSRQTLLELRPIFEWRINTYCSVAYGYLVVLICTKQAAMHTVICRLSNSPAPQATFVPASLADQKSRLPCQISVVY